MQFLRNALTRHHRSLSLLLLLLIAVAVPSTFFLVSSGKAPTKTTSGVLAAATASFPACSSLQYCKTWAPSCDGGTHYTKEQQCSNADGTISYPSICPTDNSCLVSDTTKLTSGPVDIGQLTFNNPNGASATADVTIVATGSGQSLGIYLFKSADGNPPDATQAIQNPNVYPIVASYTYNAPLADNTFYLLSADNVNKLTAGIKLPAVAGTYYFVANSHSDPLAGWWSTTDRACPWFGKITTNTSSDPTSPVLAASATDCPVTSMQSVTIAADAPPDTSSSGTDTTTGSTVDTTNEAQFGYQPQIDPAIFIIPAIILGLFILF